VFFAGKLLLSLLERPDTNHTHTHTNTHIHTRARVQVPVLLVRTTDQQVCLDAAASGAGRSKEGGGPAGCSEVSFVSETLHDLRQKLHCLQRELCIVSPSVLHALWSANNQAGAFL
jgi:hypothetical protein